MSLGTEVDFGPGHIVLDGDPASTPKGAQQPHPSFRPMSIVAKQSPISATAEHLLLIKFMVVDPYRMKTDSILHRLRLWTLEERRNRSGLGLIEVFKMAHGLSAISLDEMFHLDISGQTRGHSLKLIKYGCNKDVIKYFFIPGYLKVEHVV